MSGKGVETGLIGLITDFCCAIAFFNVGNIFAKSNLFVVFELWFDSTRGCARFMVFKGNIGGSGGSCIFKLCSGLGVLWPELFIFDFKAFSADFAAEECSSATVIGKGS
jgi:hypothetical protein